MLPPLAMLLPFATLLPFAMLLSLVTLLPFVTLISLFFTQHTCPTLINNAYNVNVFHPIE